MFTIRSQFLGCSCSGWIDEYEIQTSRPEDEAIQIISRCLKLSTFDRSGDGGYLFKRGSRFWTWFSMGPESWPLQEISVQFGDGVITIRYQIIGGIWFRGKPCGLEKEARSIEASLNDGN